MLYMSESRDSRLRCLEETVAAYGGECVCCGENEPLLLDLDSDLDPRIYGVAHTLRSGLRRRGFPKTGHVRVLCRSCKKGAELARGECPAAAEHEILRVQRQRVRSMWRRQLEQNPGLVVPEHIHL